MIAQKDSPITRKHYVIQAPRQRVWDLLAGAIVQCMPVEQLDMLNDTTFVAILKLKLGFAEIPFRLKIQVADICPIERLSTLVTASRGVIRSSLLVTFVLTAFSDDQTSVICTATENTGGKLMWLLKRPQRNFADRIFDGIRDRLERSC